MTEPALSLIVIYTQRLEECRRLYADHGLQVVEEKHRSSPRHYPAQFAGGTVLELYPGSPERTTDRLRVGLAVETRPGRAPGTSQVADPDGRVVELHTVAPEPTSPRTSESPADEGPSA